MAIHQYDLTGNSEIFRRHQTFRLKSHVNNFLAFLQNRSGTNAYYTKWLDFIGIMVNNQFVWKLKT